METIPFGLTFIQAIEAIGVIVVALAFILVVVAFVFDKLDVKSFSFRNGFTFYQEGEERKRMIRRTPRATQTPKRRKSVK